MQRDTGPEEEEEEEEGSQGFRRWETVIDENGGLNRRLRCAMMSETKDEGGVER